jgi:hypothetical protein
MKWMVIGERGEGWDCKCSGLRSVSSMSEVCHMSHQSRQSQAIFSNIRRSIPSLRSIERRCQGHVAVAPTRRPAATAFRATCRCVPVTSIFPRAVSLSRTFAKSLWGRILASFSKDMECILHPPASCQPCYFLQTDYPFIHDCTVCGTSELQLSIILFNVYKMAHCI